MEIYSEKYPHKRALLIVLFGIALFLRLLLALPLSFLKTDGFSVSVYMPFAIIISTQIVTYGIVTRQISVDKFLLFILLPSSLILTLYSLSNFHMMFTILSIVAVANSVLSLRVIYQRKRYIEFQKSKTGYNIVLGLISGIFVCLVFDTIAVVGGGHLNFENCMAKVVNGMISFFIMLFLAPIFEEPLFRGFLIWHKFINGKRSTIIVFLAQFAIFWIAHLYYLGTRRYDFYILIPLAGIVFGLVSLKTQSITSSIIAHSVVNSFYTSFIWYTP